MAHLRVDTATCAHCSRVVPYTCMWRAVIMPKSVGAPPNPKGASNWPLRLVSRRGLTPTPERPDSPWEETAPGQGPWVQAAPPGPTPELYGQPAPLGPLPERRG